MILCTLYEKGRWVAMLVNIKSPLTRIQYLWTFNKTGSVFKCIWQLAIMALDVKSRAKRYEKLDFLGEGQVCSGRY